MLLLLYRSLPENQGLPADQRWRTIEIDPAEVFVDANGDDDADYLTLVIKLINEGGVSNVLPFPPDATIYGVDTDEVDRWDLSLHLRKAT